MGKGILTDPQAMALGQCPHTVIADTEAHTGLKAFMIHFVAETVIAALTDSLLTGSLAAKTFAAGDRYYGDITAITLTSGAIVYYERPTTAQS